MIVKSERFEMRLDPAVLEKVDGWRARQDDLPSRAEAMRRLMETGLAADASGKLRFSDGEKLILWMLADLKKSLNVKGEIDPDFLSSALAGGHYWALGWEYQGIFPTHEDSEETVSQVVNILDMWVFLERGYECLSMENKERLKIEASPFGDKVKFLGFDGNNESEHLSIARFMTEKLERFPSLQGSIINSHFPSLKTHLSMYSKFEPIRANLVGRELNVDEIIKIIKRP